MKESSSGEADSLSVVGFEVSTAVTVKKAVLWDVAPCRCG
jgi:hypothetical protein